MTDYDEMFADSMKDAATLSPTGAARRDAMKDALTGAVVTRRRRRTAARFGAAAMLLLAIGGAVWHFGGAHGHDGGTEGPSDDRTPVAQTDRREPTQRTANQHAPRIVIVRDDDAVVARLKPSPSPSRATMVSDEEMLDLLAGADRPTGLIRVGKRVRFTPAVTDEVASLH